MSGRPVARQTDMAVGLCYCHPPLPTVAYIGIITQGAKTVYTNNLKTTRYTDIVQGCHMKPVTSSSKTVFAENLGVARILDTVGAGMGVDAKIIVGSPNVNAGD